jgi:hypothetical protein
MHNKKLELGQSGDVAAITSKVKADLALMGI